MKSFNKYLFTALSLGLVLSSSCNKDSQNEPSNPEAKIILVSPEEGQVFGMGDMIVIKGSIEAPDELHGYSITLRDLDEDKVMYQKNEHAHGKVLHFEESYMNTDEHTAAHDVEVEVIGILDHDGNIISQKVNIICE